MLEKLDKSKVPSDTDAMIKQIQVKTEKQFEGSRQSHDWEHTQRVVRLCRQMGPMEGADSHVVVIAAYLHDIGRSYQDASNGAICHAEKGVKIAKPLIDALLLSQSQKENILHCIGTHRFRGNMKPETIEAMVLFDADKLDAIGAVGVARAYLFAGEVGARLHNLESNIEQTRAYSSEDTGYREYRVKLRHIKDRILTKTGKKIAPKRHDFMEDFFNRFLDELNGKK
jgi:uncharacterized protein